MPDMKRKPQSIKMIYSNNIENELKIIRHKRNIKKLKKKIKEKEIFVLVSFFF